MLVKILMIFAQNTQKMGLNDGISDLWHQYILRRRMKKGKFVFDIG